MILIGQYDSPFVRRVAVAMNFYGIAFDRKVLSVFTEFESMLTINPLAKVPVLQLNDGEILYDSQLILDYLARLIPENKRLLPSDDEGWLQVSKIEVVGLGLAQKAFERAVELVRRNPDKTDPEWLNRIETQIRSVCAWLEALKPSPWFFGDALTRADIMAAVAFTYLKEKHAKAFKSDTYPALQAHCAHCEALPEFKASAYSAQEALRSGWRQVE